MIKILLLIDYSSEFDRKLLRGLVQYSKKTVPGSSTGFPLITVRCMEKEESWSGQRNGKQMLSSDSGTAIQSIC